MIKAPATLLGQIAAYAIGGGAMTALHSACYWGMATLGKVEPYAANSLAAIIAGIAGYYLHSRWTFGAEKRTSPTSTSFLRYVVVSLLCYVLNSFWVWLVVKHMDMSVTASLLPMILMTPWLGFALNRFWAFK
jgi:putative flippase GtrA